MDWCANPGFDHLEVPGGTTRAGLLDRIAAAHWRSAGKNTVGFALTVLQRRLASSPEAIYQSLVWRAERLERKTLEIQNGTYRDSEPTADVSAIDEDEFNAEELEQMEVELLDAATAARTVEELNAELIELGDLANTARQVREAGTGRKWSELSTILQDNALVTDKNWWPRTQVVDSQRRACGAVPEDPVVGLAPGTTMRTDVP